MRHRRRRRPSPRQRVRQLLQSLRLSREFPARGRDRHRRWCSSYRQSSRYPDLFWALKGGGNGSYGVVTRLTLHTHDLPEFFGGVRGSIKASSDSAFRKLIAEFNAFYASSLFNPHWGEQASFGNDNVLRLSLVFQDFTESQVNAVLQPFLNFVSASPTEFTITDPIRITGIPARHWWDPNYLATRLPQRIMHDPRPGAPPDNIWWAGNESEVGFFIHGYELAWLPASLLIEPDRTRNSTTPCLPPAGTGR